MRFASICSNQKDGFYSSIKKWVLPRGVGKPGTLHLTAITRVIKICTCCRQNIQAKSH